jgi:hypothetical protein
MSDMSQLECNSALMVRKWIGDVSAERVGQLWRAEDHEALIRTMRAADELTLALVALQRRKLLDAGLKNSEGEDLDGIRTTAQPVGVEAHAHSD